jgi:uncharacterized protein (DUF305 family)
MNLKWLFVAALLAGSLSVSAQMNMTMDTSAKSSGNGFMQDMDVSMKKMDHDMAAAPMNGDVDHDFVTMMIPHHQGAIDMAKVELTYGKDPAMRKLAEDIIAAQKKEIAEMNAWLKTDAAKAAK